MIHVIASMDNPGAMIGIAGGVFGSLIGILGGAIGVLAPRGKGRRAIRSVVWLFLAIGVGCLATGVVLLARGAPFMTWYGFTLMGVIAVPLCVMMLWMTNRVYAQAEARRMEAALIRRGA